MSRSRSSLLWFCLGVILLVASIGGAMWAMRGPRADSATTASHPPSGPAPIAVCFGRVDAPSGVVSLFPLQSGRISEVQVKEGQQVKAGELLLVLDKQLAEQLVEQARQDVEAAKAQLDLASKLRKQHELREAQQQAAVDGAKSRLKQADALLARKKEFVALGQANEKDLAPLVEQVAEAAAALRGEEQKLAELALLRAEPGQKPIEMRRAEADVAAKTAKLRQAEIALAECELRAPMAGTILRSFAHPGDVVAVSPKQPVMLLAPDEELIVRAEVEQGVAGKVFKGQRVVIEDDADAAYEWRGVVDDLSRWFAPRRSILLEPGQLNDVRTLEAIVRLAPVQPSSQNPPLRIGQRVRVVIFDGE